MISVIQTNVFEKADPSLFYPEDKSSSFLWHTGTHLSNYMVSHPRTLYS